MDGRVLASTAVDRRYREAQGFRSSAAQAKQLAEQFLARSRYGSHVNLAAGGSTGAERGTGGTGSGFFGDEVAPSRLGAPIVTSMRRSQERENKGRFSPLIGTEKAELRPGPQRGDFYSKLRSA